MRQENGRVKWEESNDIFVMICLEMEVKWSCYLFRTGFYLFWTGFYEIQPISTQLVEFLDYCIWKFFSYEKSLLILDICL